MPSGILHVYEIQDLLDEVLVQQARTVDKYSRTWKLVKEDFEGIKESKPDGELQRLLLASHG